VEIQCGHLILILKSDEQPGNVYTCLNSIFKGKLRLFSKWRFREGQCLAHSHKAL
jgi:hypothetical protein